MKNPARRQVAGVCVLAASAVVLSLSSASAELFVAQSNRDNTIFQSGWENSLGGGVTMYAGKNNSDSIRRALIRFDLAGIPAGSTINSVELELVLADISGGDTGTRTIGLHRLLGDWGEGTGGWGEGPGQTGQGRDPIAGEHPATWQYQFWDTDVWVNPGGDFVDMASATAAVGTDVNTAYQWLSTPGLVADVQGWIDAPSTNFGWLLAGDESIKGTFRTFWTREADLKGAGYDAYEPILSVDYTVVPEPSALMLFAAGSVALLVTRRQTRRRAQRLGGRAERDLRRH